MNIMEDKYDRNHFGCLACPLCPDFIVKQFTVFVNHIDEHEQHIQCKIYQCSYCQLKSTNKKFLDDHGTYEHVDLDVSINVHMELIFRPELAEITSEREECHFCEGVILSSIDDKHAHYEGVHRIGDISAYSMCRIRERSLQSSLSLDNSMSVSSTVLIMKQERYENCRPPMLTPSVSEPLLACSSQAGQPPTAASSQSPNKTGISGSMQSPDKPSMASSSQTPVQPLIASSSQTPDEPVSVSSGEPTTSSISSAVSREPILKTLGAHMSTSTSPTPAHPSPSKKRVSGEDEDKSERRNPERRSRPKRKKQGRPKKYPIASDSEPDYLSSASPVTSSCSASPTSSSHKRRKIRGAGKKVAKKKIKKSTLAPGEERPLAAAAANRVANRNRTLMAGQPVAAVVIAPVVVPAPPPPAAAAVEAPPVDQVACDQCDRTFRTTGAMRIHSSLTHFHVNNQGVVAGEQPNIIEPQFQCPQCWRKFMRRSGVESHLERAHNIAPDEAQRITDGIAEVVYNLNRNNDP